VLRRPFGTRFSGLQYCTRFGQQEFGRRCPRHGGRGRGGWSPVPRPVGRSIGRRWGGGWVAGFGGVVCGATYGRGWWEHLVVVCRRTHLGPVVAGGPMFLQRRVARLWLWADRAVCGRRRVARRSRLPAGTRVFRLWGYLPGSTCGFFQFGRCAAAGLSISACPTGELGLAERENLGGSGVAPSCRVLAKFSGLLAGRPSVCAAPPSAGNGRKISGLSSR